MGLCLVISRYLRLSRRRRLAGAERGSRLSQGNLNIRYERVRATEHAPCGRFHLFERRHGLAEIVERRAVVAEHQVCEGRGEVQV